MTKMTVGIIGAGRIGQLHAEYMMSTSSIELKGICDIHISHLEGTIFEQNVPVITTDPSILLEDETIDAIFICSSTDTHCYYIEKCAEAGKHIFCEKPISFSLEETEAALKKVKELGVNLQIGFNRRFDTHFRKVYQTITDGKVGNPHIIKITSRDPEPPSEEYIQSSGGMFFDMTIHDFDMIRYLSRSEVKAVSVAAANLLGDCFKKYDDVDTAIITLTFEDGSIGVIDNSRQAVYGYDQRIEVFGEKGVVTADNERLSNVQVATKESVILDHPKYFFLDRYKDAFHKEVQQFSEAIINHQPVPCTGEDGLQAQKLAIAAKLAWKENRPVLLNEI
ncbi:myo-inositol 2-dehydrogenase [Gracilibacillus ureilyticus]|uniref:Myo-inositol 2-dehydrogenase n=1 Tax=Gracilibacillus ureilyticus TaxID=531814 RepID=A0A1H9U8F3_9BACI|nr:inositol 2-dehydrogenase [Gracilibacillus ureilyticus]SES05735.1 myo-inositol 2-dehydrogenase [Gracilibacillus ureilyticus]